MEPPGRYRVRATAVDNDIALSPGERCEPSPSSSSFDDSPVRCMVFASRSNVNFRGCVVENTADGFVLIRREHIVMPIDRSYVPGNFSLQIMILNKNVLIKTSSLLIRKYPGLVRT